MNTITTVVIIVTVFLIFRNSDADDCCAKYEVESNCMPCQEKKCVSTAEPLMCTKECKTGCVCKKGFMRISDNISECIPECLCLFLAPYLEEQTSCYPCNKFSRYTTCGQSCPETCNPSEYAAALCSTDQNLEGCVCIPGFVKISADIDICIPKYLCSFVSPFTYKNFVLD